MDDSEPPVGSLVVTGGTGFLGLHACNHFARQGVDVTAVDLHPFQKEDEVADIEFVQGDIRNQEVMRDVTKNADAVVHAASPIPTWDDDEIREAIVDGTRTTLKSASQNGVDRVIYVSSAAVYGPRDRSPVTEESTLKPRSVYGKAKLEAEEVGREFRDDGLCVPIVRPQALIGRQRLGVFQILFDWVNSGANIPLVGSGENKYQLLHVEDMIAALELLLTEQRNVVDTEFNVGAVEFNSMRDDFQTLVDYAGTGKRVFGTPAFLSIGALRVLNLFNLSPLYPSLYETADEDTYLSVEKLRDLGWEPEYSNAEALIDTYDWYRDHYREGDEEGRIGNRSPREQLGLKPIKKVLQLI